jgi:Holliday junction resolvasome RuvABC endonuclease subunit
METPQVILGIDPSINSTGLTVWKREQNIHIYYIISNHLTKKMKDFHHDRFQYIEYQKIQPDKNVEYCIRESQKTSNIFNICQAIREVIQNEGVTACVMEGVSYGSTGSAALVDLAGLNFAIRCTLKELNIPFMIVSPTSVKSFAVGNGAAQKEAIIFAWTHCDPEFQGVKVKIDDVADSYFMSHMYHS